MGTYNVDAVVQTFSLTGYLGHRAYDRSVTESVSVSHTDPLQGVWGRSVLAADTTNMSATSKADFGHILTDSVAMTLAQKATTTYGVTASQVITALDTVKSFYSMSAADAATITAALTPAFGGLLAERIAVAHTQKPETTFGMIVADSVAAADSLARFLGAISSDTVNVSQGDVALYRASGVAAETLEVSLAQGATLSMQIDLNETVQMTPDEALRLIFSPTVSEAVEIGGIYLSPGDSITTWAMNTRNGAVTEYTNYAFNSFARIGNRYLGATSDGLYELSGDDDVGEAIVATLKGGMLQIAGSRFSSFKAAYLGMSGEGTVYLKLDAGDGRSYTYQVTAKDDETTKVHLGRGLRARYFTYTLTTAGQDFDLDTIEFIPIRARRRD